MRFASTAALCAALALAPAGCARQQATATASADDPDVTFEMTPAVGVATGATVAVALGVTLIVACGIACFQ